MEGLEIQVLKGINLDIARGEMVAIVGASGAGKSTFLQLATGQLRPSQGEVLVLGHRAWNNPPLNRSIGLCPEQDAFYEWMTGRQFVDCCARLGGLPAAAAREATAQAEDASHPGVGQAPPA
jgi:ABC-2 type transport system ATP-binding protein